MRNRFFFCLCSCAYFFSFHLNASSDQQACAEKFAIFSQEMVNDFADDPKEVALNDDVLYLLDIKKNNYLFRGGLPEQNGQFCYGGLVKDMKACLTKQGKKLSDNFQLVVISFLNPVAEYEKIELEKNWFFANQDKGSFFLYSLYGSQVDPVHLLPSVRNFILHHHDIDGIKTLMKKLKELMDSDHKNDVVIYIHCNAGKDRTGEASASYLMEFKGYSYDDAVQLDHKIAGRDLRHASIHSIRWHAFYLRDIKHFSTIKKIDKK